jgi:hypothetical protein
MIDCSKEIRNFHDGRVKLPEDIRKKLSDQAGANERRLKDGLKKAEEPSPTHFVLQGSQAMRTAIQHPDNDYDIDDGVVFTKESLKGRQGSDKTALDARKMVCDALYDDAFKKKPEVRDNCVCVFYNEGHHVDVPVYRMEHPDSDSTLYEIASADWKDSNPEAVTEWFQKQLTAKHSDKEKPGQHQMRRMVRLTKMFGISRASWNMPSGFILTVLTNETYWMYNEREDVALYNLIVSMKSRLDGSLVVRHPVLAENLTKTDEDPCMVELRDRLSWAIDELKITQTTDLKKKALKAWKKVFDTDYFDDQIEETSARCSIVVTREEPTDPVLKAGGGRFG